MVLLLGSRGRSRSRGKSVFASLSRVVNTVLGRSWWGRSSNATSALLRRDARRPDVPWLALGIALLCFAGGYLTGSHFGAGPAPAGEVGLKTAAPRTPGLIEFDARPLTSEAFVVALYDGIPTDEAKGKAKDLSDHLRKRGLATARPYEFSTKIGLRWVVAVYFDGEKDRKLISDRLLALDEDVPDATFVSLRKTAEVWPSAYPIQ